MLKAPEKFDSTSHKLEKELPKVVEGEVSSGKELEGKLSPEELEMLGSKERKESEIQELSPEEQLENLKDGTEAMQQEITRLTESVEGTKAEINIARGRLGLPPTEEDPPSVFSEKEKLDKLRAKKEVLEKQKEEFISLQEKEQLIQEEKEKILQEKIEALFKEFELFNSRDLESILDNGKMFDGHNIESKSMGALDPEAAQYLVKAFREGNWLLSRIYVDLPELLIKLDKNLTKEAGQNIEQKLKEEELNIEKEQKRGEGPGGVDLEEKLGDKISPSEIKEGPKPIRGSEIQGRSDVISGSDVHGRSDVIGKDS